MVNEDIPNVNMPSDSSTQQYLQPPSVLSAVLLNSTTVNEDDGNFNQGVSSQD